MVYYFTAEEKSELDILTKGYSPVMEMVDGDGDDEEEDEVEVNDDGGRGVPAVPDKK